MKRICFLFALALLLTDWRIVRADILWDNGPLSTGVVNTGGFNAPAGSTWSEIPSTAGNFGYSANLNQFRIADDFVLSSNSSIDSLSFYAYQNGSGPTSTFTGLFAQIWSGDPSAGASVVWGDLSTNLLTASGFANMYRTANGANSQLRPLMELQASGLDINLSSGTYWLEIGLTGSLANGPWAPTVTIPGQDSKPGANGKQLNVTTGVWTDVVDRANGSLYDFAFQLRGNLSSVPEPNFANVIGFLGLLGFTFGVRKRPQATLGKKSRRLKSDWKTIC